jgi:hypothetical protein
MVPSHSCQPEAGTISPNAGWNNGSVQAGADKASPDAAITSGSATGICCAPRSVST